MSDEMDEIWALYADDGAQALDAMETALLALAQTDGAARTEHISALFRAVHTFKGNSRVLGLAVVESRAHLAEDLIGLVRDQGVPFDEEMRDILLLASDTLREMLEQTAATRADVAPEGSEGLMRALADKVARCSGAEPAEQPVTDVAPAPAPPPAKPSVAEPLMELAAEETPLPAPQPAAADFQRDSFDELPDLPDDEEFDIPPEREALHDTQASPASASSGGAASALSTPRLADDPVYRKIFTGMVDDLTSRLQTALTKGDASDATLRREIDGLAHASRQMGLPDWAVELEGFLGLAAPDAEAVAALLLRIQDLMDIDFGIPGGTPAGGSATGNDFLAKLRDPLVEVGRLGMEFGHADHAQRLSAPIETILAASAAEGYVRVTEAAGNLQKATTAASYREAELALYEELAAVEAVLGSDARQGGANLRALLANWCADHVFDTLAELSSVLEQLRGATARDPLYARFAELMRRVHHACQHYQIETASQLAMSLLDLFARQQTQGGAPDAILSHIAQGFISTIELVFDTLGEGESESPQAAALEALFAEAASAAFAVEGLPSAAAIERRLGLPNTFQRVLSPESVRAATQAIEDGLRFYIIRTDINDREKLAEAFLDWLASNGNRPITNVTVFQGDATLFDFLIASPLDEATLVEGLAVMDPAGRGIWLLQALHPETGPTAAPLAEEAALPALQPAGISAEMLERIGEIATGQAMVHHMLTALADADLAGQVDALMHSQAVQASLRPALRALIAGFEARLHEVAQQEAQLLGQLANLQEETVAIRSRMAETVLRPLVTMTQTLASRQGRSVRMTTAGGELALDITLLDTLRGVLRGLVTLRLEQPAEAAPSVLHVAVRRDEERVLVTIEDDGKPAEPSPALAALTETLARGNGALRQIAPPGGGTRFHLSLPLTMVVLDGMVVGIDGIRYVLPVDAIRTIVQPEPAATFHIAAGGGQAMVRIGENEIVPVHSVGRVDGDNPLYVILTTRTGQVAVPVAEVVGQQLVLLRPLRGVLGRMRNLTGVALLAGGDVGMVLSASALATPAEAA